ncbi:MAG: C4-type zinc ribbon domain-containing protein [Raoultibacter sp.]
MPLNLEDVKPLLVLQQLDLMIMQNQKKLDALPQRARIIEARKKYQSIDAKQEKLAEMKKEADREVARITFEDEQLAEKQKATQEKIDASRGDYRSVEALTKELNGFAKRRNTLEENLLVSEDRVAQIKAVQDQVVAALSQVKAEEEAAIESFQSEGGTLSDGIAHAKADRTHIAAEMDADLLARYEKAAKHCGGVAIARLREDQCSACRNHIDPNRLLSVRAQAPLATCPHCARLLVVE